MYYDPAAARTLYYQQSALQVKIHDHLISTELVLKPMYVTDSTV